MYLRQHNSVAKNELKSKGLFFVVETPLEFFLFLFCSVLLNLQPLQVFEIWSSYLLAITMTLFAIQEVRGIYVEVNDSKITETKEENTGHHHLQNLITHRYRSRAIFDGCRVLYTLFTQAHSKQSGLECSHFTESTNFDLVLRMSESSLEWASGHQHPSTLRFTRLSKKILYFQPTWCFHSI